MTDPRDKASSEVAGIWSDGDLGETPAGRKRALGLAKTALGLPPGPPPPPAAAAAPIPEPESLVIPGADDDPLDGLFRADQTLRAPSIPAAPSEAEVRRWRATVRTSMFDENVSDPVPAGEEDPLREQSGTQAAPPVVPPELDLAVDPRAGARRARGAALLGAIADPVRPPPAAGRIETLDGSPLPAPPAIGRAPAEPPNAPPGGPGRRAKATSRSGVHSKTEPAPVAPSEPPPALQALDLNEREADDAATAAPVRRRRLQRGPKPAALIALALAALAVVGTVAVRIGLVASPFAPALPPQTTIVTAKPPASVPPPTLAKPAMPAPAAQTQTAVPAPSAAPATNAAVAAAAAAQPGAEAAAAEERPQPAAAAKPAQAGEAMLVVAPEELAEPHAEAKPAAAAVSAPSAPASTPSAAKAAATASAASTAKPASAANAASTPSKASTADASSEKSSDAGALTAARRFLADDEPAQAEALMREQLARTPDDHHAMELLVRALMDQDRGQDAVPFARKMVQRRGKRVAYRLLLGDVLLMAGDESGARAEWQKALELDPADHEIKRRLGM